MAEYDTPGIKQAPLEELLLFSLHVCGRSIEEFGLLEAPDEADIRRAKERLLDWSFVCDTERRMPAEGSGASNGAVPAPVVRLTHEGKLACALDWLKPESVRMVLAACASYPHCLRPAIKLAVLMSSDKELMGVYHNPDTSVGMAEQLATRSHALGDHFLALKQFEWFEKQKRTSGTNAAALKAGCIANGLDFDVLCSLQDGVERCHKMLKQWSLLPNAEQGKASRARAEMGEDECLMRVLVAGYFCRIVACIDLQHRTAGFVPLESRHKLFALDRASCLQGKDDDGDEEDADFGECISEDDDHGYEDGIEQEDQQPATHVQQSANKHPFLIYGKLQCVASRVFMKDASVIQGTWIEVDAPERWVKRVEFDPNPHEPPLFIEIIEHIGPRILSELDQSEEGTPCGITERFCKHVEQTSGATLVRANFKQRQVGIYGTQSTVGRAKDLILRRIEERQEHHKQRDSGTTYNGSVFFKSGLRVFNVKPAKSNGKTTADSQLSSLDAHFRAEGNGQSKLEGKTPLRSDNVMIFPRDSSTVVKPNHDWSLTLIEQCLRELQLKHRFTFKRSGFEMHVSTSAGTSTGAGLMEQLKQEDIFASKIIDRDVAVLSFPSWEAWWTALCREAHHDKPFWKTFYRTVRSNKSTRADLRYVRSMRRFELFGPDRHLLAHSFWQAFEKLCISERTVATEGLQRSYARWELRRLASILEELRKKYPNVIFAVEPDECPADNASVGEGEDSGDWESSDYSWLMKTRARQLCASEDGQRRGMALVVWLAELPTSGSKLPEACWSVSHKLISDPHQAAPPAIAAAAGGGSPTRAGARDKSKAHTRRCVRCRRRVAVQQSSQGAAAEARASGVMEGETQGWALTLCGCAYCRECFRDAATEGLADSLRRAVRCLKCDTLVLARDCFQILKPKMDPGPLRDQCETEWRQVCLLAEASWCQANVPEAPVHGSRRRNAYAQQRPSPAKDERAGWFRCPDCSWAMVYPPRNRFFSCRNFKCSNRVCARCLGVVSSVQDLQRCREGACAMESAPGQLGSRV